MGAMVFLQDGVDWSASGGLFDWALEYLIPRISDAETAEWLQQVVDNNLGSVSLDEFPVGTQREIVAQWRAGLVATAERELPETGYKPDAVRKLQELVDLTYRMGLD